MTKTFSTSAMATVTNLPFLEFLPYKFASNLIDFPCTFWSYLWVLDEARAGMFNCIQSIQCVQWQNWSCLSDKSLQLARFKLFRRLTEYIWRAWLETDVWERLEPWLGLLKQYCIESFDDNAMDWSTNIILKCLWHLRSGLLENLVWLPNVQG